MPDLFSKSKEGALEFFCGVLGLAHAYQYSRPSNSFYFFPIQKKYPWGKKNFLGAPSQKLKDDIPRHAILYVVEWQTILKDDFLI